MYRNELFFAYCLIFVVITYFSLTDPAIEVTGLIAKKDESKRNTPAIKQHHWAVPSLDDIVVAAARAQRLANSLRNSSYHWASKQIYDPLYLRVRPSTTTITRPTTVHQRQHHIGMATERNDMASTDQCNTAESKAADNPTTDELPPLSRADYATFDRMAVMMEAYVSQTSAFLRTTAVRA